MEFKGTVGTWKVIKMNQVMCDNKTIADCENGSLSGSQERMNAQLISCAPEMLEVLKKFIELSNESDMRPEDECAELHSKIYNIIKKATTI